MRRVGASERHSYGESMLDGRCHHSVECLDHHCSGEREIRNLHGFELHRPSSKGTKLLLRVINAIINQTLSGVRGIPRLKGTAARADGLVIKFERADAVEDIRTEARGPRIGLMAKCTHVYT